MLSDLNLRRRYRSHENDLLNNFYLPCMREAQRYSRAVGFFSSAALSLAAQGLPPFLRNGGRMRLVASPELSPLDIESIEGGYQRRQEVVDRAVTGTLVFDSVPDPQRERLGFLGWLIERELLEIKIAIMTSRQGHGIYHEKIGIFEDAAGNRVAFQGSANESRGGLQANFESILVFCSWLDHDRADVQLLVDDFESLWANETPGLEVHAFPDPARELLRQLAPPEPPETDPGQRATVAPAPNPEAILSEPRIPLELELRDYQRGAIAAWFRNDGLGVLEMATGTGKTVTALAAMEALYRATRDRKNGLFVIIVCPYQHLVRQWASVAEWFGLSPILCFQSRHYWQHALATTLREVRHGYTGLGVAIATNATFAAPAFQRAIADLPSSTLLIADEVHNLGAEGLRAQLPDAAKYRLGLSATPERWFDTDGTDAIFDYFGKSVFQFGLAEALDVGALTPYDYHPIVVHLDDSEIEEYLELTARLGPYLGGSGDLSISATGPLKLLLIQRARILANAAAKIPALKSLVEPLRESTHNLFYCGDGSMQHDTGVEGERQLEAVLRLLGRDVGMRIHRYTAETPWAERDELAARFANGDLQGLVAIRCLDEGVDIPATERAFILASSSNPRQFIQRRGRVLRPSPETGKTSAEIFDFIATPPPDAVTEESVWKTERRLVQRELQRVTLFAELARNGPAALSALRDLRHHYELQHV